MIKIDVPKCYEEDLADRMMALIDEEYPEIAKVRIIEIVDTLK